MTKYDYGVYVILLDKEVLSNSRFTRRSPDHDPTMECYYVGMSSKTPEERFKQHMEGDHYLYCRHVRKHGKDLVPELYEHLPRFETSEEAKKAEKELAVELREEGHAVYWNGDDNVKEDRMPTNDDVFESMDDAADQAKVDLFALFDSLSDEEAEGVKKFIRWFSDNYQDAGYKRLGKIIKDLPGRMR